MKDEMYNAILVVVGAGVAIAIFLGFVTTVKESFSVKPMENVDSSEMLSEQKARMADVRDQQKRLRREQEQRMRDMRRNR